MVRVGQRHQQRLTVDQAGGDAVLCGRFVGKSGIVGEQMEVMHLAPESPRRRSIGLVAGELVIAHDQQQAGGDIDEALAATQAAALADQRQQHPLVAVAQLEPQLAQQLAGVAAVAARRQAGFGQQGLEAGGETHDHRMHQGQAAIAFRLVQRGAVHLRQACCQLPGSLGRMGERQTLEPGMDPFRAGFNRIARRRAQAGDSQFQHGRSQSKTTVLLA
jgi:hypothetical protein